MGPGFSITMSSPSHASSSPLTIHPPLGAIVTGPSQVLFRAWAPWTKTIAVEILGKNPETVPMEPRPFGYWEVTVSNVGEGTRYFFRLHEKLQRPDPASRFQPEGVHGPSEVIDPSAFQWSDHEWKGRLLEDYIIYELHPGTFTNTGTFDDIIPKLSYLRDEVGVTAIELMPVAQFPGERNWGYDGTYLFAPQSTYGGPRSLHRLVNACHEAGLAVILDVVYNHFGPEGNYWGNFGPIFTDHYHTPWGSAINFDGPQSDAVRAITISNALYWVRDYHIDALRLDAVHSIFDFSAKHILQDIAEAIHSESVKSGRSIHVIAESDLNDSRLISSSTKGGYGLDGQWNDDFHHALHALVTGERQGYYQDFGHLDHLATAYRKHFVLSGQYSLHRQRIHGNTAAHFSPSHFVVFAQNHDQIGNRAQGDRLSTLIAYPCQQVVAASVLLSPFLPLIFMGEEYGEQAPFQYFIDHGDPQLIEAVRRGRLAEFKPFGWKHIPDPYDVKTFEVSKLTSSDGWNDSQRRLAAWTKRLIDLRKQHASLGAGVKGHQLRVWLNPQKTILTIYRKNPNAEAMLIILGFNDQPTPLSLRQPKGQWEKILDNHKSTFRDPHIISPDEESIDSHLLLPKQTLTLAAFSARVYQQEG